MLAIQPPALPTPNSTGFGHLFVNIGIVFIEFVGIVHHQHEFIPQFLC